jgi:hypothetical protein
MLCPENTRPQRMHFFHFSYHSFHFIPSLKFISTCFISYHVFHFHTIYKYIIRVRRTAFYRRSAKEKRYFMNPFFFLKSLSSMSRVTPAKICRARIELTPAKFLTSVQRIFSCHKKKIHNRFYRCAENFLPPFLRTKNCEHLVNRGAGAQQQTGGRAPLVV